MRVLVVAEYYPRAADPALGVWAHRQALAARDAGADVEVLVLHRPVPPRHGGLRQPLRVRLDGLRVSYVPFLAPPRPRSYGWWGAWAAPSLRAAMRSRRFDLVHAHYAAPAGDAVRRAAPGAPAVVSVHGGDVLGVVKMGAAGERAVRAGLSHARLVLANSRGIEDRCRELGATRTRVVHLGTDVPDERRNSSGLRQEPPRIVTVANLVARKRHEDVLRALADLPDVAYDIVGDGPERGRLAALSAQLGVSGRVRFLGALPPEQARAAVHGAGAFVMPSVDEAFGVAYIEAMAAGVPAIGCAGEPGPEEIARCGTGMTLVAPRAPRALSDAIRAVLAAGGAGARETVLAHFTWERCGRDTVAAYEEALSG